MATTISANEVIVTVEEVAPPAQVAEGPDRPPWAQVGSSGMQQPISACTRTQPFT